jgi:hypothetical protein
MMGRGSSGAGGGGGNAGPTRGGGRGAVSERGRGRGRGRGDPYSRPGEADVNDAGFGRGRSYLRSESWEEGLVFLFIYCVYSVGAAYIALYIMATHVNIDAMFYMWQSANEIKHNSEIKLQLILIWSCRNYQM